MKKIFIALITLLAGYSALADGTPFSAGFGLSDAAGNFGINVQVSSPSFAHDFLILRASSQADFLSAYRNDPDIAWDVFSTHRVGIVGVGGWTKGGTRLYGEFGGLAAIPASSLSDDTVHLGIYGLFGFEFFMASEHSPVSYYIEAGSNTLFDSAEALAGSPDYYSGFTMKTGLRYYF